MLCAMISSVVTSVVCRLAAGWSGCESGSECAGGGSEWGRPVCGDQCVGAGCPRGTGGRPPTSTVRYGPDTRAARPGRGGSACAAGRTQAAARPSPSIDPSSAGGRDLGHSAADRRPTVPSNSARPETTARPRPTGAPPGRPAGRPATAGQLSNKVSHSARRLRASLLQLAQVCLC